jgi:hypothetical protein
MRIHNPAHDFALRSSAQLIFGILAASLSLLGTNPAQASDQTPATASVSGSYIQQVHDRHTTSRGLPAGEIFCITFHGKDVCAGTAAGIALFADDTWKIHHPTKSSVTCLASGHGKLWFASGDSLFSMTDGQGAVLEAFIPSGTSARTIAVTADRTFVGTNAGLFELRDQEIRAITSVNQLLKNGPEVRQIAQNDAQLAVAADGGLVLLDLASGNSESITPREGENGWSLQNVRGVTFDAAGDLWFASLRGVGHRSGQGWKLYTGNEGLPWNDFTCMGAGSTSSSGVWFGTKLGAIHFDGATWEYRQGKRWLLNDHVTAAVVSENGDAWFATPDGISCIQSRPMTLTHKSTHFNDAIDRYHKRTPFGYVDAVTLKSPGDLSEWSQHDSDNDGLWTSMYGAAQCFEYAATKSDAAKRRADNAFRAVAFLSEVPQGGKHAPPRGFPARSILPISGRNPNLHDSPEHDRERQKADPLWKVIVPRWPVSADGQWYWKTDTSSDELDGHFFFYALYHDLAAVNESDKQKVREVVERITTHLIDHDYSLVDHDGQPTRWGQFGPSVLNTDKLTDCRGLNSISILSYLLVASHVTGDPKYDREYRKLLFDHYYFTNVLVPKHQNGPGSGNQSDDEMAFMCYYNLLNYEKDPIIRRQYLRSMMRYFSLEESELCPLFNFVFAAFYEPFADSPFDEAQIVSDALDTLKRFPLDRIRWGQKNSHRLDIVPLGKHIPQARGKGLRRNGKVLPIDERFVGHWNHDPWRLDEGDGGREMADGAAWLLPFWMGNYHKLIQHTPGSSTPSP